MTHQVQWINMQPQTNELKKRLNKLEKRIKKLEQLWGETANSQKN